MKEEIKADPDLLVITTNNIEDINGCCIDKTYDVREHLNSTENLEKISSLDKELGLELKKINDACFQELDECDANKYEENIYILKCDYIKKKREAGIQKILSKYVQSKFESHMADIKKVNLNCSITEELSMCQLIHKYDIFVPATPF